MKKVTLNELAALVHGTVIGDDQLQVTTLNSLTLAEPGQLTFLNSVKRVDQLATTKASACIVPNDLNDLAEAHIPLLQVDNVDLASARIHNYLLAEEFQATGIHEQAVIGADCSISEQVSIGPLVSIGDRVQIADQVKIEPGVVIGDDVQIGKGCVLHANAVVAERCILGQRVILHHGATIGSDGFGFATDPQTGIHVSKPQVGTVQLDDDVQIGANSCVDRAAFGLTHIKSGVRIDNQVMVAHNCVIGENSILIGQSGMAGSASLGRNVVLAGRVAVNGHVHLADGVRVAALSGVHNDQKKGAVIAGMPAVDVKKWGRAAAAFTRLPDMLREVRRLRKDLNVLSKEIRSSGDVTDAKK